MTVPVTHTFASFPAIASTQVRSTKGTMYSFRAENRSGSVAYLQLWDSASGPGNGTLEDSIGIPANAIYREDATFYEIGRSFANGIVFAFSSSPTLYSTSPSGSAASITKSGSVITVTGLTGMNASMLGSNLTLSGGATSGNNGSFPIATVISATSVTITNASGATDANNGAISFTTVAATTATASNCTFACNHGA